MIFLFPVKHEKNSKAMTLAEEKRKVALFWLALMLFSCVFNLAVSSAVITAAGGVQQGGEGLGGGGEACIFFHHSPVTVCGGGYSSPPLPNTYTVLKLWLSVAAGNVLLCLHKTILCSCGGY